MKPLSGAFMPNASDKTKHSHFDCRATQPCCDLRRHSAIIVVLVTQYRVTQYR